MEDVARIAGVSAITVSRVINQPDKVSAATLAKVRAAIRETGYLPNLLAGSLASNRSRIIAVLVPTIDNSIFSETVHGLSSVLAPAGYQILLGSTSYDPTREQELVAAFLGRRVDALVLTGSNHTETSRKLIADAKVPVVETWDLPDTPLDMAAGFSNFDAGAAMTRYLIARGHSRIAFAGGADGRTLARLAGFRSVIAEHPDCRELHLLLAAGSSYTDGRDTLTKLLAMCRDLDAIFFSNDTLAFGAIMQCHRLGIRVPQDLAIAGFADLPIAQEMLPALTTVQVRSRAIGETAGRMLIERLTGTHPSPKVQDLGFAVMPRDSA